MIAGTAGVARRFDDLVEQIAGHPADAHIIVNTGSSAFVPQDG
jgi:hypothetical protein